MEERDRLPGQTCEEMIEITVWTRFTHFLEIWGVLQQNLCIQNKVYDLSITFSYKHGHPVLKTFSFVWKYVSPHKRFQWDQKLFKLFLTANITVHNLDCMPVVLRILVLNMEDTVVACLAYFASEQCVVL